MILLKLFFVFAKISVFAVGGAYSFLPLLERDLVHTYGWMGKDEFLDVLGIVNVFPGAISIKYATYTGYKLAGIGGVLAANIGNMFAPVIFVIAASSIYMRYENIPELKGAFKMIQIAVFSILVAVAFQLVNVKELTQLKGIIPALSAVILFVYMKVHPALIIIGAGVLGAVLK